jgi:hypothetical protein
VRVYPKKSIFVPLPSEGRHNGSFFRVNTLFLCQFGIISFVAQKNRKIRKYYCLLQAIHEVIYHNNFYSTCFPYNSGIDENNLTPILIISPNPFTQSTQITLPQTYHNIALAVYDIQGKQVAQQQYADSDKIQLSRNQLSNGLYFLKLTLDDKRVETGKIVISE